MAFEHTKRIDFVEKNGLYDKLVIAYSFKQDLKTNKFSASQSKHDDFQPILTTNGICYTFNGQTFHSSWRSSEVTKTFNDMFAAEDTEQYFGGAGNVQGTYSGVPLSFCPYYISPIEIGLL